MRNQPVAAKETSLWLETACAVSFSSERPRKSSSCFPDGIEFERTYTGVRDPQAGMASKDQVTHADSQETVIYLRAGNRKGVPEFVTPRGSKTRSALQNVFERSLPK